MVPQETANRVRRPLGTGWWLPLAAIVAAGGILRIWRINAQSAWAPEILSVYVGRLSPGDIIYWLIVDHKHYLDAPLYYFLLHSWFEAFGAGVLQARLLALCFGILSVPAAYLLAERLVEKRTALLATAIFAVSQAGVIYSQEARPYSQLMFFLIATCYLFVRALRERRAWLWWSAALSATLMLFTHFYGLFAIIVLAIYAAARRATVPISWKWWAGAGLMLGIPAAAWFATVTIRLPITSELLFRADRSLLSQNVGLRHFGAALVWLNGSKWFGMEAPASLSLALLGALVFTLPAVAGSVLLYRAGSESRRVSVLLTSLCVVPAVAIVGLGSLGYNKYLDFENHLRYLTFCAVPYYILVAAGIRGLKLSWARGAALAILFVFSAFALRSAYLPYKADYRASLGAIAAGYQQGDCCLFYPLIQQHLLLGHRKGMPQYWHVYQPGRTNARLVDLEEVISGRSDCRRVWFFWDHTPWLDRDGESLKAKQALDRALIKNGERSYYLTEVDLYEAKSGGAGAARGMAAAR